MVGSKVLPNNVPSIETDLITGLKRSSMYNKLQNCLK